MDTSRYGRLTLDKVEVGDCIVRVPDSQKYAVFVPVTRIFENGFEYDLTIPGNGSIGGVYLFGYTGHRGMLTKKNGDILISDGLRGYLESGGLIGKSR